MMREAVPVLTLVLALAAVGLGQRGGGRESAWDHLRTSYDKDGDGVVTKAE